MADERAYLDDFAIAEGETLSRLIADFDAGAQQTEEADVRADGRSRGLARDRLAEAMETEGEVVGPIGQPLTDRVTQNWGVWATTSVGPMWRRINER